MNKIDIVDIKFIIMYKKINKMKRNVLKSLKSVEKWILNVTI